jgi:type VI secretion system protein ImpA
MATYDFAALTQPVSADDPCGPDLDLEGDPDFANFVARAEGLFPASFFKRDDEGRLQVFDRSTIDFASEFKALDRLLDGTRDLRLLTIYGRLLALNRDLAGFAACLDGVAALVRERWAYVNPKGEDGDYSLRGAVLQGLDDNPSVVLPLQHLPLVLSRRAGAISYRSIMVANGEVNARDDETALDRGTIERAFAEAELDSLKSTAANLRKIIDAAGVIQITSIENAGYDQAANLDKLPALAKKMLAAVEEAIHARDPSATPSGSPKADEPSSDAPPSMPAGGSSLPSAVPAGRIGSMEDAGEALAALNQYFRKFEPSSPAAILVQQAQRLMGKSFPEVVRMLVPAYADQAKIQLGTEKLFGLTFDQFPDTQEAWADAAGDGGSDDGWGSSSDESDAEAESSAVGPEPARPAIAAASRADAVSLLEQVSAFYRRAEPSSPIPLLTERARGLIERDFLTILKDVLPDLVPRRDD